MQVLRSEVITLAGESDIVLSRQKVRSWATAAGFRLVDQTKIVTAASELARNAVQYAGGGTLLVELLEDGSRRGLRLTFADDGPGIANIERAMQEGYTTGKGLGLGLTISRAIVERFGGSLRAENAAPGARFEILLEDATP